MKLEFMRRWGKSKKKLKDLQQLYKYKCRLEAERKIYTQTAEAYSDTDRKSRCLTIGECCIQTLEAIGQLNLQHQLIPGTLEYMINQQKVKDDTGRKGFFYQVSYMVKADEPAYTDEQIKDKVKDLARRLKMETNELFAKQEEPEEKEGDSSLRSE